MKLRQYQIDAFARRPFEGNPAAVCPLQTWPDDSLLQAIAQENNLSETAYFVPAGRGYHLRWFAPLVEVDLCGHATLAAAYVLFELLGHADDAIRFQTRSGELTVTREGDLLVMDFPARPPVPCNTPAALVDGIGHQPDEVLLADDYIVALPSQADVHGLIPDMSCFMNLGHRGVVVTAPGDGVELDFVCRFFAPKYGVAEDPVTGSAYCELAPYWQRRLGKSEFRARQLSRRGGEVRCAARGERVSIAGPAVKVMDTEIDLSALGTLAA